MFLSKTSPIIIQGVGRGWSSDAFLEYNCKKIEMFTIASSPSVRRSARSPIKKIVTSRRSARLSMDQVPMANFYLIQYELC